MYSRQSVRVRGSLPQQLILSLHELRVAESGAVLQIHVEPAELAQALHRGQIDDESLRVTQAHVERAVCLFDESRRVGLSFIPRLKTDKGKTHVVADADKAEAA